MGKLRTEPKIKPLLTEPEYNDFAELLRDARKSSLDNLVYYDLDPEEKPNKVKKALLYVADKENIKLAIRRERGSHCLNLSFKDRGKSPSSRMSATESRDRILSTLGTSRKPMQKAQIISETGISPSTWNIRIKELMSEGKVIRIGDRRDTKYSLAGK